MSPSSYDNLRLAVDGFRARVMAHWMRGDFDDEDVERVVKKIQETQTWIEVDLLKLMKRERDAAAWGD